MRDQEKECRELARCGECGGGEEAKYNTKPEVVQIVLPSIRLGKKEEKSERIMWENIALEKPIPILPCTRNEDLHFNRELLFLRSFVKNLHIYAVVHTVEISLIQSTIKAKVI